MDRKTLTAIRAIKYIGLTGLLLLSTACSLLPGNSGPVEWQKYQPATQSINTNMDHKSSFFVARKGMQNGYVFIFHIMPEPEREGYSRSNYHLMVSIEKENKPVTGLLLSSNVKHPDGMVEKSSSMMQMGDWYMALYNLDHEKGQHWITVSFEQAGKTYSTGIYYPERAYQQ